jgi:hypothetical protein
MPIRTTTHRRGRWLAVLFALVTIGAVTQTVASASASLDGTNACSVPAGYTYDIASSQLGGPCNPRGFATVYHLRLPVEGLMACTVPAGFTYDIAQQTLNQCAVGASAVAYHLRVPAAGMWACTVPPGFHADALVNQLNVCTPFAFAVTSHLAAG